MNEFCNFDSGPWWAGFNDGRTGARYVNPNVLRVSAFEYQSGFMVACERAPEPELADFAELQSAACAALALLADPDAEPADAERVAAQLRAALAPAGWAPR